MITVTITEATLGGFLLVIEHDGDIVLDEWTETLKDAMDWAGDVCSEHGVTLPHQDNPRWKQFITRQIGLS